MIASVTSNGNKGIPGDGDRYGDGDTGATEHLPLINLTMVRSPRVYLFILRTYLHHTPRNKKSTNDTSNSSSVSSTSFAVRDTALSPVSPISSTSAWTTDVDALLAALNSPATPVSIFNAKSMPTHTPLSNPTPAQTLAPLTEPPDPSSAYEQCRRLIIPLVLQNAQVYDPKYADAAEGEKLKKEVRALTSDAVCADFVGLARDMQRELDMIAVRAENDVVGDANAVAGVKRPREEEQPEARVNRIRLDHSLSISTTGDANGSSLKSKENVKVSNGNTKTVIVPNAEASTRRPEIVSDSPTTTPPLSLSIPNESSSKAKSKSLQVPLSPSADKALPRAPKAMLQGSPLQMTNSDGSRSRATTIDARGRRSYDDDMDSLTSGRSRPGRSPEGDHRLSRLRSDTSRDSDRDRYVAREDYRELPRGRRVSDYDCVDDFHGSSRRGRSPRDSDRGRLGPGGRDDYKGLPARRRTHDYTYDYDYVDEMNKPGPSRQEDWSRDDWGRGQLHHWEMDRDRDFHDHRNRKNTIDDIDRYNYPHRDVSRDGDRDRTRRGSRSDLGRRSKEPGELDDSPPLSSGGRSDMLSGDHADGQVRGRCLSSSSRRTYPPVSPMRPREPLPAPKPKSRTTTPRPARVEGEIHTQTSICQESQFQAPLISRVPGLWLAKIGLNFLDAVEVDFEVETDVATRCRPGAPAHVSVHLLCLPTASVQGEYNKIERSAPPEAVTHAMWNAKTQWPPKGSLTVELNPGDHLRRSWLPKDLVGTLGCED